MARLFILLALMFGAMLPAQAHKPSDSYLSLTTQGENITGQWDIALRDLDFAIGLDQDSDGKLTWDEIRARHATISAYALERLKLSTENGPCTINIADQLIDDHTDGAYSAVSYTHLTLPTTPYV